MRKATRSDKLESADLVAKRLDAILSGAPDAVPPGFYSLPQLAAMSGRSENHVRCRLAKSKLERVKLRTRHGNAIRMSVFYKV